MADMLSISSTAVAAYQRALSTVSNNIANVSTDGYSRQDVALQSNTPAKAANSYLGTGVMFTAVKRQYDEFAESNLRKSTSDLMSQDPLVNYSQRVMDLMGDKSVGLSSALDQFFSTASSLAADPASTVQRGSFLRSADGLASRFAELSGQLDLIGEETSQALSSAAGQFNTLTEQLALVNANLSKAAKLQNQPSELLDRRDLLLRQMSEFAGLKTTFETNGVVSVSLGATANQSVVVNGDKARPIGVDTTHGKIDFVIDPYGSTESLAGIASGTIGGLSNFISNVLEPAHKSLNFLASTLVHEVNKVQTAGIDGYGEVGHNLFAIDPAAVNEAAGVKVALNDAMRIATAAQFRVSESGTNTSTVKASLTFTPAEAPPLLGNPAITNNASPTTGVPIVVQGFNVFSPVTSVAAGMNNATFFLDNATGEQQLQVLTRDGRHILGATMTRPPTEPENEKYQVLQPSNGFAPNSSYSDAYLNQSDASGYRGMKVLYGAKADVLSKQLFDDKGNATTIIPKEAKISDLFYPAILEGGRVGQNLPGAIVPKNGVRINGVDMPELVFPYITPSVETKDGGNGFDETSTITFKALKAGQSVTVAGVTLTAPTNMTASDVAASFSDRDDFDGFVSGVAVDDKLTFTSTQTDLNVDNIAVSVDAAGDINSGGKMLDPASDIAAWVNAQSKLTHVTAQAYNTIAINPKTIEYQYTVGNNFFDKELEINGVSISFTKSIDGLIQGIRDKAALTGVTADIDDRGQLVLSNVVKVSDGGSPPQMVDNPYPGRSITIGPPAADKVPNVLGIEAGEFAGKVRLSRALPDQPVDDAGQPIRLSDAVLKQALESDIRITFGSNGKPSQLASLGLRTGAYIEGKVPDDLLVFVTGTGSNATVSASWDPQSKPSDPQVELRKQNLMLKFTAPDRYVVIDKGTGTELANRSYDASVLEPVVNYQGIDVHFTFAPNVGDSFNIDGNEDGVGNNQNMIAMSDLSKRKIASGKTLANNYIDQVNDVGNLAQQAKITQQALTVVKDQAVQSRDKISGVNLDDEAAELIRFQQAYQASAKSLQVSSQLFDAILQVR
ncbi:MAG: flagellar hook-associated protein FlgK [Betaproteobacteria bacterium]|nr:flagellar hook-associated protein FlgK [Betaproteobacteria bacterium]